jgi:hypothetical protein
MFLLVDWVTMTERSASVWMWWNPRGTTNDSVSKGRHALPVRPSTPYITSGLPLPSSPHNYNNPIVILWGSRGTDRSFNTLPGVVNCCGVRSENRRGIRTPSTVSITTDDWLAAGRPACHLLEAAGGCGNSRSSITWTPRWWWSTSRPRR